MGGMTDLTLEEQLTWFDANVGKAVSNVHVFMDTWHDEIVSAARERLIQGHEVFGSKMFNDPNATLWRDTVEEVADAIDYRLARMYKETHG